MKNKKSIFLMGDSIVEDYGEGRLPLCGWGKYFPEFVNEEYEVKNYAHSGWTTKSFLTPGHQKLYPGKSCWEVMYEEISEGDLVIICLGINDASLVNELRTSEEEYRNNLTFFTEEIRKKKADVVFGTLSIRGGDDGSEDGWDYKLPPDGITMDDNVPLDERLMRRTRVLCDIAKDISVDVLQFGEELKKVYENMYQKYMKDNPGLAVADGRNYVRYYFHLYKKPINTPTSEGGLGFNMPDREDDSTHLNPRGAYIYAKTIAELLKKTKYGEIIKLD
jgi:lysophospholipase L1-like esterase